MSGAVAAVAGAAAGSVVTKGLIDIFSSEVNPPYKKENLLRMRYIQQKYAMAYGAAAPGQDYDAIIRKVDPQSRILLDVDRPANPFPSDKAFEDSLILNYFPVAGQQGRFSASHGLATIAVIIDYQVTRHKRAYIPMVSSPGKPNDYINLFLEESKNWFRTYMTLENVTSEEMLKRSSYYERLKYDAYYWCFPAEGLLQDSSDVKSGSDASKSIHHVIQFMHDKVKHAYEVLVLEENNKSLMSLFSELNNNCISILEFGKSFLGYLLCHGTKLGYNIFNVENKVFHSSSYNLKKSYEHGKLHRLLAKSTESLHNDYLFQPQNFGVEGALQGMSYNMDSDGVDNRRLTYGSSTDTEFNVNSSNALIVDDRDDNGLISRGLYVVDVIVDDDDSSSFNLFAKSQFIIEICDPRGLLWAIKKSFNDFEDLQRVLLEDCSIRNKVGELLYDRILYYPDLYASDSNESSSSNSNSGNKNNNSSSSSSSSSSGGVSSLFRKRVDIDKACVMLKDYIIRILFHLKLVDQKSLTAICDFFEVKSLVFIPDDLFTASISNLTSDQSSSDDRLRAGHSGSMAESLPNVFAHLKKEFQSQLLLGRAADASSNISGGSNNTSTRRTEMSKDMLELRKNWGIDISLMIFDSYALLQRFAVVIGWTLEINHYFISMFGNTFTFSKFPLKNVLLLLKTMIQQFSTNATELFSCACKINGDNSYKWHCNLQASENNLTRVKHHVGAALALISTIETDHLNHEAQIKRLNSVVSRFRPFLNRIESNLVAIQKELNLNIRFPNEYNGDALEKDWRSSPLSGTGGSNAVHCSSDIADSKSGDMISASNGLLMVKDSDACMGDIVNETANHRILVDEKAESKNESNLAGPDGSQVCRIS